MTHSLFLRNTLASNLAARIISGTPTTTTPAMPVYPVHRAIFAHIPKTGGSTITTLLGRQRLLQRRRIAVDPRTKGHASIFQQLEAAGDEAQRYFKFTFVRNPWDRLVSAYHYIAARRTDLTAVSRHASFEDFINAFAAQPDEYLEIYYFQTQCSFLYDEQGATPIEFVGRFERFEDDLQHVLQQLGIRRRFMRNRKRSKRSDYRDYFNNVTRDAVAEIYRQDIDTFGYRFDDGQQRTASFFLKRLKRAS